MLFQCGFGWRVLFRGGYQQHRADGDAKVIVPLFQMSVVLHLSKDKNWTLTDNPTKQQ